MILYYMSFCDTDRPKGQQFLGATVVIANNPAEAHVVATLKGLNPGGEIAFARMEVDSLDDLPAIGRSYVDRFVPREEVMRDNAAEPDDGGEDEDVCEATLCQSCNPVKRQ